MTYLARPYRRTAPRVALGGDLESKIPIGSGVFRASAEAWRADLERAAPDLPTNFLVAWLDLESGGNPCSTGILEVGRQEAGIWQTMHPGDDRYGATYSQLRAGCNGQTLVDPSAVNHDAQMAGINMVRDYVARTQQALAASGVSWDPSSSDFWKAVKSIHGLPCILGDLLPRVVAQFGPPSSWDDFRQEALSMDPSSMGAGCGAFAASPSVEGLRNRLDDVFENAEKVGRWGGGVLAKLPISKGSFLVVASSALLLAMLWRRRRGK